MTTDARACPLSPKLQQGWGGSVVFSWVRQHRRFQTVPLFLAPFLWLSCPDSVSFRLSVCRRN